MGTTYTAMFGPFPCPEVLVLDTSRILCRGVSGTGPSHPLSMGMGNLTPTPHTNLTLSFTCPVSLSNNATCGGHGTCLTDSTCECFCSASLGFWTGTACDECQSGYFGEDCRVSCQLINGRPCSGHGTCVLQDNQPTCVCDEGYWGIGQSACANTCPKDSDGRICSGHGTCATATGVCLCDSSPSDRLIGVWAGSICSECASGWAGAWCNVSCPTDSLGRICSDLGTCLDGRTASGECVCPPSALGPACDVPCPTIEGRVCNGHGSCRLSPSDPATAYCECSSGWTGPMCTECAALNATFILSGPDCSVPCPIDSSTGLPCGGPSRGTCDGQGGCLCVEGRCGPTCETSDPAECVCPNHPFYYGPLCDAPCPGLTPDGTAACSGHGTCSAGPFGSGLCQCHTGYWSDDSPGSCGLACPGLAETGSPCAGHGTCLPTGACQCDAAYVTDPPHPYCGVACPVDAFGHPCAGHGRCVLANDTHAVCQDCTTGYWGPTCEYPCPGGPTLPCHGHGTCSPVDGSCTCDAHWALDSEGSCSLCAPGYHPPGVCDRTCNTTIPNQPCSGHGHCILPLGADDPLCECHASDSLGYWVRTAPLYSCDACDPAHFGPTCTSQCPGVTSCGDVCSGHGVCDSGVLGSGLCTCHDDDTHGHWQGTACSECRPLWAGPDCATLCPVIYNGTATAVCAGHGTCDEGVRGTGACVCLERWDPSTSCADCTPDFYGPDCSLSCPEFAGATCGGHGTCDHGLNGTGVCECSFGWLGPACETPCPVSPVSGLPCHGHGHCVSTSTGPQCVCDTSGPHSWTGTYCDECTPGYWGPDCASQCPGGAVNPCGGPTRGHCLDGSTGNGTCVCLPGFGGPQCELECPYYEDPDTGTRSRCGHGSCVDGQCVCDASPALGFWALGPTGTCSVCAPTHANSEGCRTACPVHPNGTICGGYPCSAGRCLCDYTSVCGEACEVPFEQCLAYQGVCSPSCTNGGVCVKTNLSSPAVCVCPTGYYGQDCSLTCPGGPDCSGHGTCRLVAADRAACQCDLGWTGVDCSLSCPLATPGVYTLSSVCGGHGTCTRAGTCVCDPGYSLNVVGGIGNGTCIPCPGFPTYPPCYGHGTCLPAGAQCDCHTGPTTGWWDRGSGCRTCAVGYGTDFAAPNPQYCTLPCDPEGSLPVQSPSGYTCACRDNYGGANCSRRCPAPGGALCSGHGVCLAGTCVCEPTYYGPDCGTFCTPDLCRQPPHNMLHPACSPSGGCVCADGYDPTPAIPQSGPNDVPSNASAVPCAVCLSTRWGPDCSLPCSCNGHGVCNAFGACVCDGATPHPDEDPDALDISPWYPTGRWSGSRCEACLDPSLLLSSGCVRRQVSVTTGPLGSVYTGIDTNLFTSRLFSAADLEAAGRGAALAASQTRPFVFYALYRAVILRLNFTPGVPDARPVLPDGSPGPTTFGIHSDSGVVGFGPLMLLPPDTPLPVTVQGAVWDVFLFFVRHTNGSLLPHYAISHPYGVTTTPAPSPAITARARPATSLAVPLSLPSADIVRILLLPGPPDRVVVVTTNPPRIHIYPSPTAMTAGPLASHDLPLASVRAVSLGPSSISQSLVVGGSLAAGPSEPSAVLLLISFPDASASAYDVLAASVPYDIVQVANSPCPPSASWVCAAVEAVAVTDSLILAVVSATAHGTTQARLALVTHSLPGAVGSVQTPTPTTQSRPSPGPLRPMASLELGVIWNTPLFVPPPILDPLWGRVFVLARSLGSPSTMFQISLPPATSPSDPPVLKGDITLATLSDTVSEVAMTAFLDPTARFLLTLVDRGGTPGFVDFTAYAMTGLARNLIDQRGGTPIIVRGEGFYGAFQQTAPQCRFYSVDDPSMIATTTGSLINSTAIICPSPPLVSPTLCLEEALEVGIFNRFSRTVHAANRYRRVQAPNVLSLTPSVAIADSAGTVYVSTYALASALTTPGVTISCCFASHDANCSGVLESAPQSVPSFHIHHVPSETLASLAAQTEQLSTSTPLVPCPLPNYDPLAPPPRLTVQISYDGWRYSDPTPLSRLSVLGHPVEFFPMSATPAVLPGAKTSTCVLDVLAERILGPVVATQAAGTTKSRLTALLAWEAKISDPSRPCTPSQPHTPPVSASDIAHGAARQAALVVPTATPTPPCAPEPPNLPIPPRPAPPPIYTGILYNETHPYPDTATLLNSTFPIRPTHPRLLPLGVSPEAIRHCGPHLIPSSSGSLPLTSDPPAATTAIIDVLLCLPSIEVVFRDSQMNSFPSNIALPPHLRPAFAVSLIKTPEATIQLPNGSTTTAPPRHCVPVTNVLNTSQGEFLCLDLRPHQDAPLPPRCALPQPAFGHFGGAPIRVRPGALRMCLSGTCRGGFVPGALEVDDPTVLPLLRTIQTSRPRINATATDGSQPVSVSSNVNPDADGLAFLFETPPHGRPLLHGSYLWAPTPGRYHLAIHALGATVPFPPAGPVWTRAVGHLTIDVLPGAARRLVYRPNLLTPPPHVLHSGHFTHSATAPSRHSQGVRTGCRMQLRGLALCNEQSYWTSRHIRCRHGRRPRL